MARPVARRGGAAPPALPDWIRPQLTELVDAAPDGPGWLHEIKYDGYRMHARLDRGAVKLLTRTGLDWTHKYPAIAKAVAALDARQAYLGGELCGAGPDGVTSFNIVQLASDRGNALFARPVAVGHDRCQPLALRSAQNHTYLVCHGPHPTSHGPVSHIPMHL